MDFLVSQAKPDSSIVQRYETVRKVGTLWVAYARTGNVTVEEQAGEVLAIISGTLFGPLADTNVLEDRSECSLSTSAVKSDGSFAVAIPRGSEVTVVTDAGGSIPVYCGQGPSGFAVGTLVHHIATVTGLGFIDPISVVDYLLNQSICYPYSWFEEVRILPPGSVCSVSQQGVDCHTYWEPKEPVDICEPCDEREWGKCIHQQISSAVEGSIEGRRSARILYSGGSDSRAILGLIPSTFECTPTTILDRRNREYQLAKHSARLLGRNLEWIQRPEGYYDSKIEERIDRIGPGWDFRNTHIYGSIAESFKDVEVVLGGYSADSLFKTNYMSNVQRRWGRPDRLLDPAPDVVSKPDFLREDAAASILRGEYVEVVRERRREHHRVLKNYRPLTAGSWHSLWPLSNLLYYGHYLSDMRMEPRVAHPFLFSQSYRLAAAMPDMCRVDQRALCSAFSGTMGLAGLLPVSSGRVPRLNGLAGNIIHLLLRGGWKVRQKLTPHSGYEGAWSPKKEGQPIRPEEYLCEEGQALLFHRLSKLLEDKCSTDLFSNTHIPKGMRVRALALAFDMRFKSDFAMDKNRVVMNYPSSLK